MRRILRSTTAIASVIALVTTGCQSTPAAEATPTAEPTAAAEATETSESVADTAASETEEQPAAEATETRDGVLLDYYRDDSRGTIQTMEGQLKPLEVVQPDKPDNSSGQ